MRSCNTYRATLAAAFLCLLFVSGSAAVRGDEGEDKAQRLIKANAETIAFFAHPTCTLNSNTYQEKRAADDGFELVYVFRYTTAFDNRIYTKWAFHFDEDGNYKNCRAIATDALVPPFTAAGAVVSYLKNKISEDPDLGKNKELQALIEKADAKALLRWQLKANPR